MKQGYWFEASLVADCYAGSGDDLSRGLDLSRVLLASSRESLVGVSCIEFCCEVRDSLVNVELFAAEYVDESMAFVWEGVDADMALSDNDEPAYAPFFRFVLWLVDKSVGWADLVHRD